MRKIVMAVFIVLAVVLFTQATAGTAAAAAPNKYYCVQHGDTLYGIAARHGISQWSLAYANGIWKPDLIYVGQTLMIPGKDYCYKCGGYYPRQDGYKDDGYKPGGYKDDGYKPGGYKDDYKPIGYKPYPMPSYKCNYWVKYGDTMIGIARRFHTDPWTIAHANKIYNLNWIYAGMRLHIPGCW